MPQGEVPYSVSSVRAINTAPLLLPLISFPVILVSPPYLIDVLALRK